jgi:hypothetical protein
MLICNWIRKDNRSLCVGASMIERRCEISPRANLCEIHFNAMCAGLCFKLSELHLAQRTVRVP